MESGPFGHTPDIPSSQDEQNDDLQIDSSYCSNAIVQSNELLDASISSLHNGRTQPRTKKGKGQHLSSQNDRRDDELRQVCGCVDESYLCTDLQCRAQSSGEQKQHVIRSKGNCLHTVSDVQCNGDITDVNTSSGTKCKIDVSANGICVDRNGSQADKAANKVQIVRPKTISWSRTVKQRKEKREKDRKKEKVNKSNHHDVYIYPELCSSSDEDLEDCQPFTITSGSRDVPTDSRSVSAGQNSNSHHGNTNDSKNMDSSQNTIDSSTVCSSTSNRELNDSLVNGSEQFYSFKSNSLESYQLQNSGGNSTYIFNPHLLAESDCILAPLAVPEDSGGSSMSSNSDLYGYKHQLNDYTSSEEFLAPDGAQGSIINSNVSSEPNNPKVLNVNNISCEENLPNHEQASPPLLQPLQYSQHTIPLARPESNDSLDEVGDYIETDFPSKASRLLFACSSNSSSASSDSDEGYGVNCIPRVSDTLEQKNKQSILQTNTPPHRSDSNESENRLLLLDTASCNEKTRDKLEDNVSLTKDCVPSQAKRLSRLGSSAGESGSEVGGQMGSDSSVLYSPEIDFMEFMDSDLPTSSSSIHQSFAFNGGEMLQPFLSDGSHYCSECVEDGTRYDSLQPAVENGPGICQGAEAPPPPRNNLNYERCYGDFEDGDLNLERYDPYLHVDNENYHYVDKCKQEKVPRANFQNSESNRQEKVFCKVALERENRSTSSCSSEDEENIAAGFVREVAPNVERQEERIRQNSNSECMYLEDLENLTHALQNAVIMQLPPKLEESSGDSSDDPIYEEIESLESFLSSSDNSLHMVKEETIKTADNVARVLPKFERRKRRGNKPHCFVEKVMIWNEYEAYVLQVKQIGTSACGPTAILNVLKAFDFQVDKDDVCKKIHANMRMEAAPIPYYLFARSTAGTTSENLVDGINKLTNGTIRGRFFHFFPPRKVELLKWLGYWMKKGAVPIATLNLQRGVKPGWTIPDAWHHQMVYGVSSKGVYLTNPLEIVAEETMMEQLTSDSVLLIRRQDVVNRFRDWAPLNDFLKQKDQRWQTMNVLGQVVNVLREACTALSHQVPRHRAQLTSHVTIPAAYKAGITMFARHNSELEHELFKAPELQIKDPDADTNSQEFSDGFSS